MVLVAGEAGAGKTALTRAFADAAGVRVLWGGCDALFTPRPLGPIADVAADVGGELERLVEDAARPHDLLPALLAELRRPSVLVLEDLHWADEATLDLVRLLGRRLGGSPSLVLCTYRDDELGATHPLRPLLAALTGARGVRRLTLATLSAPAVRELASGHAVDPDELHRRTGGNPFYVTEVLAAPAERVPVTVRDAVLARAAGLSPGGTPPARRRRRRPGRGGPRPARRARAG